MRTNLKCTIRPAPARLPVYLVRKLRTGNRRRYVRVLRSLGTR